jgi:hypothetical protein
LLPVIQFADQFNQPPLATVGAAHYPTFLVFLFLRRFWYSS